MRTLVAVLIGLVAGFLAGLVVDQIIGVVGLLTSGDPGGFRFLPLVLAAVGAVVAVVVDRQRQRRSAPPRR
ncbi:hypothetical protein GCM10017556_44900 [Micromonospora sagamiensis]|uniref:Uncharacterized protein n=1 Tax=Micromonospora sagamiensis TaxID=47875 RepID=A0A562WIT9_9ACTN|nr:hypothetical protein JD81_03757 [Micromonospora sagamiensis]BCL16751.1 hypothetical protein GCM10017556_44900 [Micromonospora sagamiensis]